MKKLLLSGCIVFGSISFASAQAADVAVPTAANKATTTAKNTNPQKAAVQAQDMSARGSRATTGAVATPKKKPLVAPVARTTKATDKSAIKQ